MDLEKAVAVERMANNGMLHVEIVADIDRRLAVDRFRGGQPGLKVLSRWADGVEHKVVAERVCKEYSRRQRCQRTVEPKFFSRMPSRHDRERNVRTPLHYRP